MAAGSAGEGAGSNTELRWTRFQDERIRVNWKMELARMARQLTRNSRLGAAALHTYGGL